MLDRAEGYRKYRIGLKHEVARAGQTNLFPMLRIPRTTAAYWISKRKTIAEDVQEDVFYQQRIAELNRELEREKSLRAMVEQVRKLFPYKFTEKIVKSPETKRELVSLIQTAAKLNPLKLCFEVLGLTPRIYYRWVNAARICSVTGSECARRHPNQLTDAEVKTMRRYLESKEYAHIPVQSLCMLAKRNGELFCSADTWYKYKKMYDWKRPHRKWNAKRKNKGVRATKVNEIWHVDITHIKLGNGKTAYLQTVIDNFSRYVVSWRLTQKVSATNTVKCLSQSEYKSKEVSGSPALTIMSDGGPENRNRQVAAFIRKEGVDQVFARADIVFSNSMVEAFFRSLKSNFLKFEDFQTRTALLEKLKFYFNEHNQVIPHSALGGARPSEVYSGAWTWDLASSLKQQAASALELA